MSLLVGSLRSKKRTTNVPVRHGIDPRRLADRERTHAYGGRARAWILLLRSGPASLGAAQSLARHDAPELFMIEFAAGILVGGSVGAVIMGALLSQVRTAPGVRDAAALQAHAPMQALRHAASRSARRPHRADTVPVLVRTGQLAVAGTHLH
jgi:hypothetical protein